MFSGGIHSAYVNMRMIVLLFVDNIFASCTIAILYRHTCSANLSANIMRSEQNINTWSKNINTQHVVNELNYDAVQEWVEWQKAGAMTDLD
jgi:hypothetical protein